MFTLSYMVVGFFLSLLVAIGSLAVYGAFKFLVVVEFIFKDLPIYLMDTFEEDHPWSTIANDFWFYTKKYIIVGLIVLSPFIVKGIVKATDISDAQTPYSKTEVILNKVDNKIYGQLEKTFHIHTKRIKLAQEHPLVFKISHYPLLSNRFDRRFARHTEYINNQVNK